MKSAPTDLTFMVGSVGAFSFALVVAWAAFFRRGCGTSSNSGGDRCNGSEGLAEGVTR